MLPNRHCTAFVPPQEQLIISYCKILKYLTTQTIAVIILKFECGSYHRVTSPKDADGMANSVDPDQTAHLRAVWSGSTVFAQAYLSKNLGSLWKTKFTYDKTTKQTNWFYLKIWENVS